MPDTVRMPKNGKKHPVGGVEDSTSAIESALIEMFSDLARLLGNPPSCGAIYGLLFASEQPLSMDEIILRLNISKGSTSQGLRQLTEVGAINRIKNNGERPARYLAELELRRLIAGFLRERLIPRIESSAARLDDLKEMARRLPESRRDTTSLRLAKLSAWHQRAMSTVPLALHLLQDE